jgi:hypothetical protein
MKVTVQNGAAHGLTRRDVEAIIPLLPASWARCVEQIVLYQGETPQLRASFYPKQKTLGLFWPVPSESASKEEGLQELLLALSIVAERGDLPDRVSPALRERHEAELAALGRRCLIKVVPNAA